MDVTNKTLRQADISRSEYDYFEDAFAANENSDNPIPVDEMDSSAI